MLVDTGFLVALYIQRDKLHSQALAFLQVNKQPLITTAPVIVESCYFLDTRAKVELLQWVVRGGLKVIDIPIKAYPQIAESIEKYADHDIDFTDATLIWLANEYQQREILTVDKTDFSVFRLKNNHWFELLSWY